MVYENNDTQINYRTESEMFDRMSDYYDRYRPGYPQELVDIFLERAEIHQGDRLLEIGAGSGKATEQFCGKGLNITCIEPGVSLAEIGQRRFPDERFEFVAARFEDMEHDGKSYDAVFSAQAFHWIAKPDGYIKSARLLKKGGMLALIWNMYITYPNDTDRELTELSARYGGFADFLSEAECEARIDAITREIEQSGLFSSPEVYRRLWKIDYTADDYYGFVMTGNRFVQKSCEEKEQARNDISRLAQRHGGIIERPYLCVMYLASKLS